MDVCSEESVEDSSVSMESYLAYSSLPGSSRMFSGVITTYQRALARPFSYKEAYV
jgi:hypothetical protein